MICWLSSSLPLVPSQMMRCRKQTRRGQAQTQNNNTQPIFFLLPPSLSQGPGCWVKNRSFFFSTAQLSAPSLKICQ